VSEVARRWQVCSQQVFGWRRAMRLDLSSVAGTTTTPSFVPIVSEAIPAATVQRATSAALAIEVELAGVVVRASSGMGDAAQLTAVLRAVRASAGAPRWRASHNCRPSQASWLSRCCPSIFPRHVWPAPLFDPNFRLIANASTNPPGCISSGGRVRSYRLDTTEIAPRHFPSETPISGAKRAGCDCRRRGEIERADPATTPNCPIGVRCTNQWRFYAQTCNFGARKLFNSPLMRHPRQRHRRS
jgi:transposase